MKHRWGFDLSMSAVRLMRREAGHWREVASTPLGADDMDQQLRALVEQVPEPRVVDIFLPGDQILYTDVKLNDPDKAVPEIEAAMDGRTPYALSDLEIDWEIGAENTARVAAIARVTLSEAEAFADQCGLKVSRFSSLPEAEDFPRQPDFGIGAAGDAPETRLSDGNTDEDAAAFATSRAEETPEASPEPSSDVSAGGVTDGIDETIPVVRVEDPAPVMQVTKERSAPLDPGPALPRPQGAPRVRADLSLPDGGGRAAASLTPPEAIDPYGKPEAKPAMRARGLGIGLAAILTAGIALIVWSILPETAEESDTSATLPNETAIAAAPTISNISPDALVDLSAAPAVPVFAEETGITLQPVDRTPRRQAVALLDAPLAQSGVNPEPLLPPDAPAIPWTDVPAVFASLASIPDESGFGFATPVPPVTRPGNVGLPGVQGFEPGIAPPSDEAPAYVPPRPPVVAVVPPAVMDVATEEETSDVATIDTTPASDDTDTGAQIAALTDENPAEPGTEVVAADPVEPEVATPDASTETADVVEPALPRPTELAAALTDTRSRARPSDFVLEIERQVFGGRTKSELATIRPPGRPDSAQIVAEAERGNSQPSTLAVSTSPDPSRRPDEMGTIIARALAVQREQRLASLPTANTTDAVRAALGESPDEAATNPRNSPRLAIPSNTDVARQATVEDAIRLNRLNLVGVFGLPSDRRALVRLPSGRYVKVKIGDRVDGGTIAAITDDALQYRKGGRVFQLNMPQG